MRPSYQTWTVRGYLRPVVDWDSDGVPFAVGYSEPVVVVFDPRGWEWHVTMEGGIMTSFTVRGHTDSKARPINAKALSAAPLHHLSKVAAAFLGEVEHAFAEDSPLPEAFDAANADPGAVRRSDDRPRLEEFARVWLATPAGERRKHLAKRFGVSPFMVDKWTRAARDAGLLPPAKVGRHRTTESQPGTPARARERNEE
jgi:hypothetical protein